MRELLKDFQMDTWIPAAGECGSCSAPYEVRIEKDQLDSDGTFGNFAWRIKHGPNCNHRQHADSDGVEINENNVAGWKYRANPTVILGTRYDVYTHIGDTAACVRCSMIVPENPIILFGENGDGWLAVFCIGCDAVTGVKSLIREANQVKQK